MSARDELARVLCSGVDGAWFCQNFDREIPGGCSRCTRLADAVLAEWLPTLPDNAPLMEAVTRVVCAPALEPSMYLEFTREHFQALAAVLASP